jgi:hypothetical protein
MTSHSERVLAAARYFQKIGLSPIPAAANAKRPDPRLGGYAKFRNQSLDKSWWDHKDWLNLQLMCGCEVFGERKIIVVDCDGHTAATQVWPHMNKHYGRADRTWTVQTPSGGRHYYYLIPVEIVRVPSRMIWGLWSTWGSTEDPAKGTWLPHEEVRILGDGSLSMAPPSALDGKGEGYTFVDGHSPRNMELPAIAPKWLIDLPAATALSPNSVTSSASARALQCTNGMDSIDKISVARSWGVKFTGGRNPRGWLPCHVPWREDRTPSGSFHADSGILRDNKDGTSVSLCSLGVRLGVYPDSLSAFKDLSR